MKRPSILLAVCLAIVLPTPAAFADRLAIWHFNTGLSGISSGTTINANIEALVGSPTLQMFNQTIDANGKGGRSYTDSIGVVHTSPVNNDAIAWEDFRGAGDDGEIRITCNTTGFDQIRLRFDLRVNDSPLDNSIRFVRVQWSTDGVNFNQVTNFSVSNNNAFAAVNLPLFDQTSLANKPLVVFRLSQGGASDGDALDDSVSFDNFEITGVPYVAPTFPPVLTVSGATTPRLSISDFGLASGVIGDSTDPAAQQGIVFTLADPDTPVGSLTVTRATDNAAVVPLSNLVLTGSGATRTLKITPTGVGFATITVTLSDPQGNSDTYTITYGASAAASTPLVTRYHTGASDASAAVPIGTTHMLVANDEDQVLRLYERANSGLPVATFDQNPSLGLTSEADLEAAVQIGSRVYWIGSHGNSRTGQDRPARRTAFSTDLTGSGAATVPVYVNKYTGLRTDLINWDNANGHGLGAGALGLSASAAAPKLPTVPDGFNIEAATLAPGGGSKILLGFRAPLQNTTLRNLALVIPATNLASVIDAGAGPVAFGTPAFLDLGGRAIRSMDTTASGQVLILAGPVDNRVPGQPTNTFQLFLWDGNAASAPVPVTSTIDATAANAVGGSPEAVFDLPAALGNGTTVGILVDNGSSDHYGNGRESKDLATNWQKFRADPVTLTGLAPLVTTNADDGAGSLRQAITDSPPGGTILFAPSLSGQTIPLTSGQLLLSKNLTIDASALPAGLTISGEDAWRIFEVSGQTVTLRGLTLRDGFATAGGAIFNNGGVLTVSGCTLLGNIAQQGGAIYSDTNLAGQKTTLLRSTVTGNLATVRGGGVYNFDGLTEVRHCTIVENATPSGEAGGIASYGDAFTQTLVTRSIVTGNERGDVEIVIAAANSFVSGGYNLVGTGDALAAFIQPGDMVAAVPMLAPLGAYGGPTTTMPPRRGSPAVDAVLAATTLGTDQRGAVVPADGNGDALLFADIGAVEFQVAVVANAQDAGTDSLREVLARPLADGVTFDPAFFNGEASDTITLVTELAINRGVFIDGTTSPAGVTISGNDVTRVMSLGAGANVTIQGLTITGGSSGAAAGGGIVVDGGARFEMIDSSVVNNSTTYVGGGLMVFNGAVTMTNSTFAQNTADDGGAIWCQGPSTLNLRHTTVSGNGGNRAILSFVGMRLENSIVAGNPGANLLEVGTLVPVGVNFTTGDPLLMPLGNYGGRTPTMPPLPWAEVTDTAASSDVTTDQRGAPRPIGFAADIGAAEFVSATVTSSANSGLGTLRDTVALPFVSYIDFSPVAFNGEPGDTIALTSEIQFANSVFLDASQNARGVIVSGRNLNRIFRNEGTSFVRLDYLTLTGGNSNVEGGAILNSAGAFVINRCTLSGNTAQFGGGAISSRGGSLTLTQCTLSENTVTAGGVNFGGGAIFNLGTMALTHCTISGNITATQNQGGGIINAGPATLAYCIVAGNTVGPGGVGADILNDDGFVQGTVTRVGPNLIQDYFQRNTSTSSGPPAINAPPLLAPLDDYGGPTRTMALLPGSPARNAAIGSTIATDQRGFVMLSAPPDLGAYEAGNPGNFKTWAFENLPLNSSRAFADDADQNGLANGLDYAFLTDVLVQNPGPLPQFVPNALNTEADLVFPVRLADQELIYEIERSTELGTWTRIAAVNLQNGQVSLYDPAVTFIDLTGSYLTFRDPFIAGQLKVFYRLVVRGR